MRCRYCDRPKALHRHRDLACPWGIGRYHDKHRYKTRAVEGSGIRRPELMRPHTWEKAILLPPWPTIRKKCSMTDCLHEATWVILARHQAKRAGVKQQRYACDDCTERLHKEIQRVTYQEVPFSPRTETEEGAGVHSVR